MSQSAGQKYYCKFTWVYSRQETKSKPLQKFITQIYNLVYHNYSGVLDT